MTIPTATTNRICVQQTKKDALLFAVAQEHVLFPLINSL